MNLCFVHCFQASEILSGSPSHGEPLFLLIGRLRRTHGLSGEMLVEIITDFPDRLLNQEEDSFHHETVYVGESHRPLTIESARSSGDKILLKFKEFNSVDECKGFESQYLYVNTDKIPDLPKGYFYHHQLLGLTVRDKEGTTLGELKDIIETGANDVYVVQSEGNAEILLPAIESVIISIDLENRVMIAQPQEWL